ncbi:MAG: 2Fe-2S iron-sulfur cluster-binding protein [Halobellus sp.]
MADPVPLTVVDGDEETVVEVERGTNLREALLERGFSVYGTLSTHANCGGRGLCATCTVEVDPAPDPTHWHDAAAVRFGYPRLSCQIAVTEPTTVRLLDKHVWGQVLPRRRGGGGDDGGDGPRDEG